MEEDIYKGSKAPSRNKYPRADTNRARGRNQKGQETALHTGSAKAQLGKRKSNHADLSISDKPDALLCMIHGTGHSSE